MLGKNTRSIGTFSLGLIMALAIYLIPGMTDIADAKAHRNDLEPVIRARQLQRITSHVDHPPRPWQVSTAAGLLAGPHQHRVGEIRADDPGVRSEPAGPRQGQVPGSTADVQHGFDGIGRNAADRPVSPSAIESEGHQPVHSVVPRSDRAEHAPDPLLRLVDRHPTATS